MWLWVIRIVSGITGLIAGYIINKKFGIKHARRKTTGAASIHKFNVGFIRMADGSIRSGHLDFWFEDEGKVMMSIDNEVYLVGINHAGWMPVVVCLHDRKKV